MLWAQVLKTKYFLTTNLFDSVCNPRSLHIWTALCEGMQWLRSGMKWIVGDGQTINVWQDSWLPGDTLRRHIVGPLLLSEEQRLVTSLHNNHNWTFDCLQVPLANCIEQLIQGIHVTHVTSIPNAFVWPHNNGIYSVKSASKYLFQTKRVPNEKPLWNWIWKLLCPKKIQFFIWKVVRNQVPTRQYLAFSRPYISKHYPRYNFPKTTIHSLRDYSWAKEV